jgi:hypothetical protein
MQLSGAEILAGLSLSDLEALADENPGLRSPLIGYVAEFWLKKKLLEIPGVISVVKIPDRDSIKGDFLVTLRRAGEEGETSRVTVEAKCVSRERKDPAMGDRVLNLTLKSSDRSFPDEAGDIGTLAVEAGLFDVLAVCLLEDGEWSFWFINAGRLERHEKYLDRLKTNLNLLPNLTPFLYQDFLQSLA